MSIRLLAAAVLVAMAHVAPLVAQDTKVTSPYETAPAKPLEPKEEVVKEADDHTQYRVEFNGIKDDRVPAFLYVPKKKDDAKTLPAILLQYGSGGNKKTDYI